MISLSSGEAELHAASHGLRNLLDLLNVLREFRGPSWGSISTYVDASSCKAIMMRKGAGSLKHLEAKDLWVQSKVRDMNIAVVKVPRVSNFADGLASPCTSYDMDQHLQLMSFHPGLPTTD